VPGHSPGAATRSDGFARHPCGSREGWWRFPPLQALPTRGSACGAAARIPSDRMCGTSRWCARRRARGKLNDRRAPHRDRGRARVGSALVPAPSMPQWWSGPRSPPVGHEQTEASFRCNKWGAAKRERHHANQTDLHHTAVGGGCFCGSDRRRTDGCCGKWALLLGKYLPIARQCSDQRRPSPRSVLSLRRSHAVSARRPRRPSRRPYGLTPKVAAAVGPPRESLRLKHGYWRSAQSPTIERATVRVQRRPVHHGVTGSAVASRCTCP
jgi:hypothetical protein